MDLTATLAALHPANLTLVWVVAGAAYLVAVVLLLAGANGARGARGKATTVGVILGASALLVLGVAVAIWLASGSEVAKQRKLDVATWVQENYGVVVMSPVDLAGDSARFPARTRDGHDVDVAMFWSAAPQATAPAVPGTVVPDLVPSARRSTVVVIIDGEAVAPGAYDYNQAHATS